uniref:Uncharacterized protein n=1 Tax=Arundo donax TaxID=35708 RepID=A0A0A8YZP8_ARUDO
MSPLFPGERLGYNADVFVLYCFCSYIYIRHHVFVVTVS